MSGSESVYATQESAVEPPQYAFRDSRFFDLYREWGAWLKPTLRVVHRAGEKLFVDFAGQTM